MNKVHNTSCMFNTAELIELLLYFFLLSHPAQNLPWPVCDSFSGFCIFLLHLFFLFLFLGFSPSTFSISFLSPQAKLALVYTKFTLDFVMLMQTFKLFLILKINNCNI